MPRAPVSLAAGVRDAAVVLTRKLIFNWAKTSPKEQSDLLNSLLEEEYGLMMRRVQPDSDAAELQQAMKHC